MIGETASLCTKGRKGRKRKKKQQIFFRVFVAHPWGVVQCVRDVMEQGYTV